MIPALLFENVSDRRVRCLVCAHRCELKEGQLGVCGVRQNIGGSLYSLNGDRVAAVHLDPIEKKPLYHFQPGSSSFSIAAVGCNFSCPFCQNYSLSVVRGEADIVGEKIDPPRLVDMALQGRCRSISYTYSEPTVFFELMVETAKRASQSGLKNVMVTNGFMSAESLEAMGPYLDAANVDLKAFSEDFYRQQCHARLDPVLQTIRRMKAGKIWVEVTTLLIPGLNSDLAEIEQLISFLLDVDPDMPWHVSRFFPQYRLTTVPATDTRLINQCLKLAESRGLKFLYSGNVAPDLWSDTRCPACHTTLVKRTGYHVQINKLKAGKCGNCGAAIAGVWE